MGAAQGKAGARTRRRILGAMLLATGLAAGPLAQASPYLQQFSYFKKLKEAEAAVDAPAVFARLEAMDRSSAPPSSQTSTAVSIP